MRIAWCCVVLALGMMAGCVEVPFLKEGMTVPPPTAHEEPPVTADQVNETNAPEKAEALRKELAREAQPESTMKVPATKVLP